MKGLVFFCSLIATGAASAQQPIAERAPKPIQDNSFLIEEAYNQESGVVQHISTFARTIGSNRWSFAFTQEWPVGGARHQLSFTLPFARVDETTGGGVGDVGLNYRYQLVGSGDEAVALAPRISILAPTGSSRRGQGTGGTGIQFNLPLSIVLSRMLVVHSNAGATYTRRAHNPLGDESPAMGYNLGQSAVWLVHPKLNVMLEGAWTQTEEVVGPGEVERNTALLVAPGLRGAIDFPSGLQIVPGIAFPIGLGASRGEQNVFFYLSFEHPFTKTRP
ncbi:MAG: transporter [Gemmatimonadaceae bacterium]|nr:transporter [Gemmatimonadaceae bacterium]